MTLTQQDIDKDIALLMDAIDVTESDIFGDSPTMVGAAAYLYQLGESNPSDQDAQNESIASRNYSTAVAESHSQNLKTARHLLSLLQFSTQISDQLPEIQASLNAIHQSSLDPSSPIEPLEK